MRFDSRTSDVPPRGDSTRRGAGTAPQGTQCHGTRERGSLARLTRPHPSSAGHLTLEMKSRRAAERVWRKRPGNGNQSTAQSYCRHRSCKGAAHRKCQADHHSFQQLWTKGTPETNETIERMEPGNTRSHRGWRRCLLHHHNRI